METPVIEVMSGLIVAAVTAVTGYLLRGEQYRRRVTAARSNLSLDWMS